MGPGVPEQAWMARGAGQAQLTGRGQAAVAAMDAHGQLSARTAQLVAADERINAAASAAAMGHRTNTFRLDRTYANAGADVSTYGPQTNTQPGQRALVSALTNRLEETKSTLEDSDRDAKARSAEIRSATDRYKDILGGSGTRPASVTGGGTASPALAALASPAAGAMAPAMAPMMGAAAPLMGAASGILGAPAQIVPAVLSGLTSLAKPATSLLTPGGNLSSTGSGSSFSGADPAGLGVSDSARINPNDVKFDKVKFPGGRAAVEGYINQALDVHGITDPAARARWMNGLLVGYWRESTYDPLAVNKTDLNAHGPKQIDDAPFNSSRGVAQCIPTTFAQYHMPGTSRYIYDPVAGISASINYLINDPKYRVGRDASRLYTVGQFNPHHAPGGY
jgi:hypothetical protein